MSLLAKLTFICIIAASIIWLVNGYKTAWADDTEAVAYREQLSRYDAAPEYESIVIANQLPDSGEVVVRDYWPNPGE